MYLTIFGIECAVANSSTPCSVDFGVLVEVSELFRGIFAGVFGEVRIDAWAKAARHAMERAIEGSNIRGVRCLYSGGCQMNANLLKSEIEL